jgi:hypothetical protein
MNVPGFSTNGLKALQDAIRKALEADNATPAGQDKAYGVREFPDWKEMADELEAELDRRGETYTKVPW